MIGLCAEDCCCTTTINRTVKGCAGVALSGVGVTVTISGSTVASGTTDGSGVVSFLIANVASGTSATIAYTPPGGSLYSGGAETVTLNCGTLTANFTLSPIAGYSCSPDSCCSAADQSGPPYAVPVTYPSTTYLTDPVGTITLTRFYGHGNVMYAGRATRSAFKYGGFDGGLTFCTILDGPQDVGLLFVVGCKTGGGWALSIYGDQCYNEISETCGSVNGTAGSPCASPLVFPSLAGDASCQASTETINYSLFGVTNDSSSISSFPHCPGGPLAGTFSIVLHAPIFGGGYCPMPSAICPWIYGAPDYSTATVSFSWSE